MRVPGPHTPHASQLLPFLPLLTMFPGLWQKRRPVLLQPAWSLASTARSRCSGEGFFAALGPPEARNGGGSLVHLCVDP